MIIKILLILAVLVILYWLLRSAGSAKLSAANKIVAMLFFAFAVFAIISPNITNKIAHKVGVGRGADLLLYILTTAFIGFTAGQYMHRRSDEIKLYSLARKLAIYEANTNKNNQTKIRNIK